MENVLPINPNNKLRFLQNTLALSAVTLIVTVWATVSYLAYQNKRLKENSIKITSYEECVSTGNTILESYPSVCITKDEQRFVQKITGGKLETEGWKTYTNYQYDYQIKYPPEWTVREKPTVFESPPKNSTSVPEYSVSVDVYNKTVDFETIAKSHASSCTGSCPEAGDTDKIEGVDYTIIEPKVEERNLNGTMIYFLTTFPSVNFGSYERNLAIIPISNDPTKYIKVSPGFWPDEPDNSIFNQILSTFKFSDKTSTSFICPENGWVNCQPILSEKEQQYCTQEAFDWYEENCPNYEGAAY